MLESSEIVVSHRPFIVRRVARWADCDPAGGVFVGRFNDYLLGAVMHFMRHIGYGYGSAHAGEERVALPCKHLSLTFHASLRPEQAVDIRIAVEAIRRRSFDLLARASLPDGRLVFQGQYTPVAVCPEQWESVVLPRGLRECLAPHGMHPGD